MHLVSSTLLVSAICAAALGCSDVGNTGNGSLLGAAGVSGVAGQSAGGSGGTVAGASGSGGAIGAVAGSGGTLGAGGSGGVVGAGGTAGAGGAAAGGAGGAVGSAGAATGGTGGSVGIVVPIGPSSGCNKAPPVTDTEEDFVTHEITIQAPIAAQYLVGGDSYENAGPYDFQFRPYGIRLPAGYDPTKTYPVIMGGGGCGGNAQNYAGNPGAGFDIDQNREAIFVGLAYVAGCFADGGGATNDMPDTPEVPYVHEVLEEVKANYCVDQSRVFMTGTSSGGWQSITVGCALATEVRGIAPVSGGLRLHRPPCTGPQASIFVEGLTDGANPIYEDPPNDSRDSPGSGPARDEILVRNGCVAPDFVFSYPDPSTLEGTSSAAPHVAWDAGFPSCVTYTGCPAEYPVVWCALPCGHQCDNEGGRDYKDAMMLFFNSLTSQ